MSELFASGRVADLVLAVMAIEAVLMLAYYRLTGRGVPPLDLAINSMAGVGLVLALRNALTGGPWTAIAPWLVVALCAHVLDVARRWH